MDGVIIRPTRPTDAEGIIAHWVELASEPDIYVSYTPAEADVPVESERQKITRHIAAGNLCLVAEAEGRIVADFACIVDTSYEITRHTALLGMSVDRRYRNQGIGKNLMERAIGWAEQKRIVRLELEVYADNAAAIHLYKKFGFEVEGRKRMYAYQRGRYYDSLIMSRLFK